MTRESLLSPSAEQLESVLNNAIHRLPIALARRLPLELLLSCVEQFARLLQQGTSGLALSDQQRDELLSYCRPTALQLKIERELGEHPFQLRRINYRESTFEGWRPLGCVLHVMPSNAPLLPFLAVLESLLAGNINWVRPSSNDGLSAALLNALVRCDSSGLLADYVFVLPMRKDDISRLLPYVDGVSAWGSDAALGALQHQLRPGCRWIPWGHKISFTYLTPAAIPQLFAGDQVLPGNDARGADAFDIIVDEVCRYDQQACSSPQLVLVDSDDPAALQRVGQELALAFGRREAQWPAAATDLHQAAEITTHMMLSRMKNAFERQQGQVWSGAGWQIIWEHQCAMDASPLYRTVLLRPMPRQQLCEALRTWRGYLQTCGLHCAQSELATLSQQLIAAGVGRITTLQGMHQSYVGEPHDNVRSLTQFSRRVSVRLPADAMVGQATLEPAPVALPHLPGTPIMDRAAFVDGEHNALAQLFFRSSGSTGAPVLSAFSYRDYHRQMRAAADGLFAAGLDPNTDRVINMLYGGNLHGGFLSSFLTLDKLGAVHFPMGNPGEENYTAIAELIVEQNIDTIIGMPSAIHLLFRRCEQRLRAYGGVRKIFFGGEDMSPSQRTFISGFGVSLIRSAMYGSNDAGPLGHACAHGEDGIFHLLTDVQRLEVVSPEHDEPVPVGTPGRLLFTSLAREAKDVTRYDLGDVGYLLEEPCACGLPTPRFRLLGRHDHLLRIGTLLINMTALQKRLDMPVQFILDTQEGIHRLTACVDGDAILARARLSTAHDLGRILNDGLCLLETRTLEQAEFERQRSGKTAVILDRRFST